MCSYFLGIEAFPPEGVEGLRLGKLKRLAGHWKLNTPTDVSDAQKLARFLRPLPRVPGAEAVVSRGPPRVMVLGWALSRGFIVLEATMFL